jgi:hypothetical protein
MKRLADGSIDKFKARLVIPSFTQCPGLDFYKTYATVIAFDSLQLLLAITAVPGWHPQQVDEKSAFRYGNLKEETYLTQPEGHGEKSKTIRFRKCIYSLKQSSQKWYQQLTHYFVSYEFVSSNFDLCVLTYRTELFFIAIYVDNITLYGPSGPMMKNV